MMVMAFEDAFSRSASYFHTLHPKVPYLRAPFFHVFLPSCCIYLRASPPFLALRSCHSLGSGFDGCIVLGVSTIWLELPEGFCQGPMGLPFFLPLVSASVSPSSFIVVSFFATRLPRSIWIWIASCVPSLGWCRRFDCWSTLVSFQVCGITLI